MFRASAYIILSILWILTANSQHKSNQLTNWKNVGEFPATKGISSLGLAGQSAGVFGNIMIVAGGTNFPDKMPWEGGKKVYYDDVFLYTKNAKGILTLSGNHKLPMNLGYAATVSTELGLLMAGGENETGILNKVMILKVFKDDEELAFLPDLPIPLTNAMAVVYQSSVYVMGGETVSKVSDKVFVMDLNNTKNGWTSLPPLPNPISHGVAVFFNGQKTKGIYVLAGRAKKQNGISDLYSANHFFDINTKQWTLKAPLPYGLSAGTGLLDPTGRVLLFGGDRGEVFSKVEAVVAQKNKETDSFVIETLDKKRMVLQSTHPGFSHEILAYDIERDRWDAIGSLPFPTPVTTHAFMWDGFIMIPGGEVRAGVRTPHIFSLELNPKK
jgi:N-acetylneuraminic acid mutarotase